MLIMGHNMASWRILEEMVIELRKKGVSAPANIVTDLRSAKLMIQLSCGEGSTGDAIQKAEEYLSNVEAYLVTETQNIFGSDKADLLLRRLEEANAEVCEEQPKKEDKYITGVPRDQKWVRVEPIANLPSGRIQQIAKEQNLQVNQQKDGRLVVYGQQEDIKEFLKKMATTK